MTRLMVYNCRGGYEARTGGAPLIGTGLDGSTRDKRRDREFPALLTLVLALAAALVLVGCGAGSGGAQPSGGEDGGNAGSSNASERETAELGTPALGREDAPVVLTEFADYQ